MSPEQQRQLPNGGARMIEIEQKAARLSTLKEGLIPKLPTLKGRTTEAVVSKLMVVSHLLHRDEHPEAHRMITDSIEDLRRIHRLRA
jgi:hypothetical protein